MPSLVEMAGDFLQRLSVAERAAMQQIVDGYAGIVQNLDAQLTATLRDIAERRAAGQVIVPSLLRRVDRLTELIAQAEAEFARLALMADYAVTGAQQQAVTLSQQSAQEFLRTAFGDIPQGVMVTFNVLPNDALRILVGTLQDGSPLFEAFEKLGQDAIAAIRRELIDGMAAGLGPREVARRIRRAVGANMEQALTIARTAIINAYREANRRTFEANADVLMGWVWVAKLDKRTCSFCWAQHGTLHELSETMATHARCRCTPVPRAKSWADLGFPMIGANDAGDGLARAADD